MVHLLLLVALVVNYPALLLPSALLLDIVTRNDESTQVVIERTVSLIPLVYRLVHS